MEQQAVRWNITVSKETDAILRTFLGAQGTRKGDLSKFVEGAVRRRVFSETLRDIKAKNADIRPDDLLALVDEAVGEVRADRRSARIYKH